MKLDASVLRYLSKDEFRILTAIELGMRNHALVPTPLIPRIATLPSALALRLIRSLHKHKLVYHESKLYDGYRLTYLGYDFLALHALVLRGQLTSLGQRIGVGKEADVYACEGRDGAKCVLKLHRLGRISFRRVKEKRDYLIGRTATNWLYLSRLAAEREYQYLTALHAAGLSVPQPLDASRHVILMQFIDAQPLGQVYDMTHPSAVYSHLVSLAINLANHGLVHSDYNEWNLLYSQPSSSPDAEAQEATGVVTMIDFPQMITTQHPDAAAYFARDIGCITRFFMRRFQWQPTYVPTFEADVTVLDSSELIGQEVGGKRRQDGEEGIREEERREFERMMERYIQTGGESSREEREAGEAEEDDEEDEDEDDVDVGEDIPEYQELLDEDEAGGEEVAAGSEKHSDAQESGEVLETKQLEQGDEVEPIKESSDVTVAEGEQEDEDEDDEEDDEDAAFRARMKRKEARQQGERMRQQKRNERRQQQHEPHNNRTAVQPADAEAKTEETEPRDGSDEDVHEYNQHVHRAPATDALDAQLVSQIKAKLKHRPASSSHSQSVSKSRNIVKNKKAFKLKLDIESQL